MKKWYYIIFIIALYIFSQTFQEYVLINGIIYGILAGVIIAFLAKLVFSVITKTVIFLAVIAAIGAFLISLGYLEIPFLVQNTLTFF